MLNIWVFKRIDMLSFVPGTLGGLYSQSNINTLGYITQAYLNWAGSYAELQHVPKSIDINRMRCI